MQGHDPSESRDLRASVRVLPLGHAADLTALDWADGAAVALAEKRGRIVGTLNTLVEKTLAAEPTLEPGPTPEEFEAFKRELHARLVRHAQRLGKDELDRRLAARGIDASRDDLELLAAPGPDAARR